MTTSDTNVEQLQVHRLNSQEQFESATIPANSLAMISVDPSVDEINVLHGLTATTTELNTLDGITATTAELNILDGVTATTTELNYTDGVTSNIQTQLDDKAGVTFVDWE